ncbi:IS66 family insertion sequence element accessory protein TnpB [Exilibacterium tricleocarpae]|uniref:IS66 family insertion sequence element accessory protein TnpB n=2 Tax=Exilibacterium tricleocarpae TaxID=2591008 RepID=A0A545SKX8_9GAMM|nr:IS66 family insertion sequence element accessory protein TnpB [Exilibacterium tricleocarpae]
MRKSYDGLSALVSKQLQENPLSGQLFVFINKRKTHMKILYFDDSGYCIWCKRLEQGQFNFRTSAQGKRQIDWAQLRLLLDGIEVKRIRQYKRYSHPK